MEISGEPEGSPSRWLSRPSTNGRERAGARHAVATDISDIACDNIAQNAIRRGVEARVEIVQGDMFAPIDGSRRFDLIYWNSNFGFLPQDASLADGGVETALFDRGYVSHRAFFQGLADHREVGARCFLGFASLGRLDLLLDLCREFDLSLQTYRSEEVDTDTGPVSFDLLEVLDADPTARGGQDS